MIRTFFILAFHFTIYLQTIAQSDLTAGGGDGSGPGGDIAFSIGQVAYTSVKNDAGEVSAGVQQAYLAIMVSNEEVKPVFEAGLYPNPVHDEVYLDIQSSTSADWKAYTFMLLDVSGREIYNGELQSGITNLNVAALTEGMYLLHVMHKGVSIQTFKVIKTK